MKTTTNENRQLFEELKKYEKGSKEYSRIFGEIVSKNERLVGYIAQKFKNGHEHDFEDIISTGKIGLMKAVQSFELDRGLAFATYAARCVENQMLMYLRHENKSGGGFVVSLNSTLAKGKDGGELELEDVLASDVDVEADVVDTEERESILRDLFKYIDKLPPKQSQVLKLRYLSGDGDKVVNQRKIAKILGLEQSYVSRIEKSAIKNLKILIETGELKTHRGGRAKKEVEKKPPREVSISSAIPKLKKIVNAKLSKRQTQILKKLYFTAKKTTQKQIADKLGISFNTVSLTKQNGLKKLLEIYNQENPKKPLTNDRLIEILEKYKDKKTIQTTAISAETPKATLKNIIVSNLTKRQSLILLMLYYAPKKVKYAEVAKILKLTISTINNTAHNGLNSLQVQYNKIFKASLTVEQIRDILKGSEEESES